MEPKHSKLTIAKQCKLLGISRSSYYYKSKDTGCKKKTNLIIKILRVLKNKPFYGYRKIAVELNLSIKKTRLLMSRNGLRAIYPKKRLTYPNKYHKKYPYLLKGLNIWLPNQVWSTDITYIKLLKGYAYLIAIIDLYSRKVLSFKISNTHDAEFCVSALQEAIHKYGIPAIFNTDQGSEFTSDKFTEVLKKHKIRISMDSKGRALDNIYIERLWRSVKYEDIYLNNYETMNELKDGIKRYFKFYNSKRFHQSLEYKTPDEMYNSAFKKDTEGLAA